MARGDVSDALLHRFVQGWGADQVHVFAVLSEEVASRGAVAKTLARHRVVSAEWWPENTTTLASTYVDNPANAPKSKSSSSSSSLSSLSSSPSSLLRSLAPSSVAMPSVDSSSSQGTSAFTETFTECRDGNTVRQLKQWSRCMDLVEQHEASEHTRTKKDTRFRVKARFKVVVKMRPDDLWYAAMVPWCSLDLSTSMYLARQRARWSDQFLVLPRRVAGEVLRMGHTNQNLLPSAACTRDGVATVLAKRKPPFEAMVFFALKAAARKFQVAIRATLLPRLLTRDASMLRYSAKGVDEKCERFLWFMDRRQCHAMSLGDIASARQEPGPPAQVLCAERAPWLRDFQLTADTAPL